MPKHGPEARLAQLLAELDNLRVDRQLGIPAPYQQLVLLWAIGRTRQGMPRMIAFNDAKIETFEASASLRRRKIFPRSGAALVRP